MLSHCLRCWQPILRRLLKSSWSASDPHAANTAQDDPSTWVMEQDGVLALVSPEPAFVII